MFSEEPYSGVNQFFAYKKKKSVTALLTAEKSMIGEKKKMNYKVELVLY